MFESLRAGWPVRPKEKGGWGFESLAVLLEEVDVSLPLVKAVGISSERIDG